MSNVDVGKSTAGDRLKRAYRNIPEPKSGLKVFARGLIQNKFNDALMQDAKDWFECKAGVLNAKRSTLTEKRLTEEKMAKKAARSKKK